MGTLDIDLQTTALLLVDIQPDFLPGSALAVEDGDAILDPVRRLVERDPFGLYVATQDWHPPGHVSFASSHPGQDALSVIELHGHDQTLWPVDPTSDDAVRQDLERAGVVVTRGEGLP
jgi:nicotinamidase/pyrazinamidase